MSAVPAPSKAISMLTNALTRRVEMMFPGYFTGIKHNHYVDFGFPTDISFELLHAMYSRNSLAKAAVDKTVRKTWQDPPWLLERARDGSEGPLKKETRLEKAIRQHFAKIRFWTKLMEADRRSLVGRYSAVILRIADDLPTDQPLGTVSNGLDALVDVIPVWEGQLRVSKWDDDTSSITYGEPLMFEYDESTVMSQVTGSPSVAKHARKLTVHPSRVVVWSIDGSMDQDSALKAGYNDLLSIEKIVGAGGEGFWRNAKQAPVFEMDKEADVQKMARAMGIKPEDLADIMNDQVADWQQGFDKVLMIQGMTAKSMKVEMPDPESFYMNALQSFAASFDIPLKVLVGTQTGERASTEDASQWNQTCNFRRKNTVIPNILEIVKRLEMCGVLKTNPEWFVDWTDLTESTMLEKIDRAGKMAKVNKDFGDIVFMPREIRASVGYEPAEEAELAKLREATQKKPDQPGASPTGDPDDTPEDDNDGKE
jgi:hypothetical protein